MSLSPLELFNFNENRVVTGLNVLKDEDNKHLYKAGDKIFTYDQDTINDYISKGIMVENYYDYQIAEVTHALEQMYAYAFEINSTPKIQKCETYHAALQQINPTPSGYKSTLDEDLLTYLDSLGDKSLDYISQGLSNLFNDVINIKDIVVNWLNDHSSGFLDVVNDMASNTYNYWSDKLTVISNDVYTSISDVKDYWSDKLSPIVNAISDMSDITSDYWSDKLSAIYDYVVNKAKNAGDWISDKASEIYDWCSDKLSQAWTWIENKASDIYDWCSDKLSQAWTWIENKASDIYDWCSDKLQSIQDWVSNTIKSAIDYIDDKTNQISNFIGDNMHDLSNFINPIIDKAISGIESSIDALSKILDFPELLYAKIADISDQRWIVVEDKFIEVTAKIFNGLIKDMEWLYG